MRIVKWLGILLLGLIVIGLGAGGLARLSDGPLGPFAGGTLEAGPLESYPDDWSFANDLSLVEFQLLEPPRSRTVGITFLDGRPYIPCFFPGLRWWKQWPHEALRDPRAMLRVGGKRYEVQAVRVEDPAEYAAVYPLMAEAYGAPAREQTWIFRLDPR